MIIMDNALVVIANLVRERCGINFTQKLDVLERKIKPRTQSIGCDYTAYLEFLNKHSREWTRLVELLTVHETYFFRESNHFRALTDVVMRDLVETKGMPIRIWSAACSSGEEPYTISMSLLTAGHTSETFQIIATDIDQRTLTLAEKAWYSKQSFSFRRTPDQYRRAYFDEEEDGFRVQSRVTRSVQFRQLNLLNKPAIRTMGLFDVIFCRNVLIYFDDESKLQVLETLHDRLKPGGYLFLGHADHVSTLPGLFSTVRVENTFFYQKGEAADGLPSFNRR